MMYNFEIRSQSQYIQDHYQESLNTCKHELAQLEQPRPVNLFSRFMRW